MLLIPILGFLFFVLIFALIFGGAALFFCGMAGLVYFIVRTRKNKCSPKKALLVVCLILTFLGALMTAVPVTFLINGIINSGNM